MATKTSNKDTDEHYDRRKKEADESFCATCGAIIKKEAEICPKCGVRNKPTDAPFAINDPGKPKGSIGWLIFWVLVFWPVAIVYGLIRRWK